MQTKDHYILARHMARQYHIKNPLNRAAFVLGNVMPDIDKLSYVQGYLELKKYVREHVNHNWRIAQGKRLTFRDHRSMLVGGHTAEGSRRYLNRRYRQLKKKEHFSSRDYYRMGKMLHYLVDRFTHPHTMEFKEGFFAHVDFEERLHRICRPHTKKLQRILREKVPRMSLQTLYRAYRSETPTPYNDYAYILAAYANCMEQLNHESRCFTYSKSSL